MLNQQIKELAIHLIKRDRYTYRVGQRVSDFFVAVTVIIYQKQDDLCRSHRLPAIFQIGEKTGCKMCLEISRNQFMFRQEELPKAA